MNTRELTDLSRSEEEILQPLVVGDDAADRVREEQQHIFARISELHPNWSQRRCMDRSYIELMKRPETVRRFFTVR